MKIDFDKLYADKYEVVKAFVYKYLHNEHDAEDVTQQTFLALYEYTGPVTRPEPLLFAIAKNKAVDLYRQKKSRKEANNGCLSAVPDVGEIEVWVRDLPLSPELRLFTQGYTYDEIAVLLGLHTMTVRRRIHYERKALREKVDKNDC